MRLIKNYYFFSLTLIFLCLSYGCSYDNYQITPYGECDSLPNVWEWNDVLPEDKVLRNAPVSNPNNYREFAYIADDNGIIGIWKYNLETGLHDLIIEFDIWDVPDWSKKDWLIFGKEGQLFKCKSNGDSIIQITNMYENYSPNWSPDGNKIIYRQLDGTPYPNLIIADENGNIISTLDSTLGYPPSWSPDGNKIAFLISSFNSNKLIIGYIDLSDPDSVIKLENSVPEGESLYDKVDWSIDSKNILWSSGKTGNLLETNIDTQKSTIIKEGCPTTLYYYHTVLSDGIYIISVKEKLTVINEITLLKDYDLVKISFDGTETIIPY